MITHKVNLVEVQTFSVFQYKVDQLLAYPPASILLADKHITYIGRIGNIRNTVCFSQCTISHNVIVLKSHKNPFPIAKTICSHFSGKIFPRTPSTFICIAGDYLPYLVVICNWFYCH